MAYLEDILIPIGFFAMVAIIVWLHYKFSIKKRELINKERTALIEKGVYDFPKEYEVKSGINLHKYSFWGFVISGLGIGLLTTSIIIPNYCGFSDKDVITTLMTFGLIFLFPGLGMLMFYAIQSRKDKKEKINTNSK